jgi:hypothetical protein
MNTHMNNLKRYLGIVWIVLGPIIGWQVISQGMQKISAAAEGVATTNTILQWSIIWTIFTPIGLGLMIFGYYAYKGDYDHLPESSAELKD